jgi:murein DD-endopeptidase MepM/ murein hydrolase activator NlpD
MSTGLMFGSPMMALPNMEGIESKKAKLNGEKNALKENLQETRESVREETDKKKNLDRRISSLQSEIDISNKYITSLEAEITACESDIDEINLDIKRKLKALKSSLKSIYIAGNATTAGIILGAETFDDLLDKSELVFTVSRTITELIDQLNTDFKTLEEQKTKLEVKRNNAEFEIGLLDRKREELQGFLEESEVILSRLHGKEQQIQKEMDENDSELKRIEAQIKAYYEAQRRMAEEARRAKGQNSEKIVHKGAYVWPVPGFYSVSSDFYDTQDRNRMHGAIDIAGPKIYGARVVAAGDGSIAMCSEGSWGGGYGTYAMIDHGGGCLTLYGHMSGLAIKCGDAVKKGQVIGYVGNTGFSTGPHLHFEIRIDGIKVNPMKYFGRYS